MLILEMKVVNPNTLGKLKSDLPISEQQYFSNSLEDLKNFDCPNCHEHYGLFKGFFWIGCRNCMNLFITPDEYLNFLQNGTD